MPGSKNSKPRRVRRYVWCGYDKHRMLATQPPTCISATKYDRVLARAIHVGGHSFSTYAQISRFQTHPPTLYAQIMTSLWQQYIGIRKALDLLSSSGVYVLNEWPLNEPHIKQVDIQGKAIKERILRNGAMFRVLSLTVVCRKRGGGYTPPQLHV